MSDAPRLKATPAQLGRLRGWQGSTRRFWTHYTARPGMTFGLLASFIVLHLATGLADVVWYGRNVWMAVFGARSDDVLVRFGARAREPIESGEVWRLLSCGFLHGDLAHILFNGLAFWGLGRLSEAVYGPVRLLWLFLLSVLGGSVLSQLRGGPLSVGASGGIFGMMGALVVFGWRRQASMPPELREVFGRRLWPWIVLNLMIGAMLPFIDNWGHVGGLIAGALCGTVLRDRIAAVTENGRATGMAVACGFLLAGTALGMAFSVAG